MSLYRGPSLIGTSTDTTHAMVLSATAAAIQSANDAAAVADAKTSVLAAKAAIDIQAAAIAVGPVQSFNTRFGAVTLQAADVVNTGFLNAVNNTSDASKPVSIAQANALALKADSSALAAKLSPGDIQAQTATAVTTAGSSTAYAIATLPAQPSLQPNQRYQIKLHTPNGATPTLARDGLTAAPIRLYNVVGGKVSPSAGQLPTVFDVVYDGTDYVVLNPLPATGGATGASGDTVFVENSRVMNNSYSVTVNKSASTVGPLTIPTGKSITVASGERLVVL